MALIWVVVAGNGFAVLVAAAGRQRKYGQATTGSWVG